MSHPQPIVIFGAGGFGREVAGLVREIEMARPRTWELLGLLDDSLPDMARLDALGLHYLGDRQTPLPAETQFVVAVGSGETRRDVAKALAARGLRPATLVHPSAILGGEVRVGPGSVVCAGSVLTTNISFGAGAQINLMCTVGHDVLAGDFVTMSPAVSLSGAVTVGDLATIYTRAVVNPMVSVGSRSVLGAGAVVTRDVPDGTTVVGVPAKPISSR